VQNILRGAWLGAALLPGTLVAPDTSPLAVWVVWTLWASVAIGVLVPHPLSLTVIRFFAPLVTLHAAWMVAADDGTRWSAIGGVVALIAVSIVAFLPAYGEVHAQAAAYGHERRHLLRPPVAVVLPVALLWSLVAVAATFAVYSESLVVAGIASAAGASVGTCALRRALVLARRWLVFVPAGIAVHDPLVLRDTFMVRSHDVRGLRIAAADTEAFDTTCVTWGEALELQLAHPHDVSLSQFGARIGRTLDRLHVTALLVAPSRPSRALANQRPAAS